MKMMLEEEAEMVSFYHISIIKSYLEERSIPEEDDDVDDDDCRVFFFLIHIIYYVKYLTNSHDFGVWLIMKEKENISRKPEILQQLRHSMCLLVVCLPYKYFCFFRAGILLYWMPNGSSQIFYILYSLYRKNFYTFCASFAFNEMLTIKQIGRLFFMFFILFYQPQPILNQMTK